MCESRATTDNQLTVRRESVLLALLRRSFQQLLDRWASREPEDIGERNFDLPLLRGFLHALCLISRDQRQLTCKA